MRSTIGNRAAVIVIAIALGSICLAYTYATLHPGRRWGAVTFTVLTFGGFAVLAIIDLLIIFRAYFRALAAEREVDEVLAQALSEGDPT